MSCVCKECGKPMEDCESELCRQCLLDWCYNTDAGKNLSVGGRFYGEKLEKEKDAK